MAAAAAAPRTAVGPSAVDASLGRLATIRQDAALFLAGAARADGVDVVIEVAADAARREGWTQGTTVQVTATGAEGRSATATATLAAGERNARVSLRAADVGAGPWRIVARAAGRDGAIEDRLEVPAGAAQLVGEPVAYRALPSPRSPLRPLADARVSRLERLRVEWDVLAAADAHTARLLDRAGKPLGQPLPFAPLPEGRTALAVDLPIGPLSEGDYVIELVATRGDISERRLLAFRVIR
jgi:hypothetical protein